VNQISLIVSGYWDRTKGEKLLDLLEVGIPDLYYKLEKGYINYAKAHAGDKAVTINSPKDDYRIMRFVWEKVVRPYHVKHQ
jgi:hypothetical protein